MPVLPQYSYGFSRISIIPWITPNPLNILKHFKTSGEYPRSCHGLAKDRHSFVTVSLRFFTYAAGLMIRGDPASEPGQWDSGLIKTKHCFTVESIGGGTKIRKLYPTGFCFMDSPLLKSAHTCTCVADSEGEGKQQKTTPGCS